MMCADSSTVLLPVGTAAIAQMFESSGPPDEREDASRPRGPGRRRSRSRRCLATRSRARPVRGTGAAAARS